MRTIHRIAKNFFSLLTGSFLSGFVSLITYGYLARIIGPSGFGKLAFAAAVVAYFSLITDMGLNNLGIREIAKDKSQTGRYAINIFPLKFILSLVSLLFLSLFVLLINKPPDIKVLIFLFGLGLLINTGFVSWVYMGLERMEIPSIMQPVSSILMLLFVFLLIKTPNGLMLFPIINLFVSLFVFLALSAIFLSSFKLSFKQIDVGFWRELLAHALPMGLSYILIQIYYNFDTILLGFMRSSQEVGLYSAAYKIILAFISISAFFYNSIYPTLSRFFVSSSRKFELLLKISSKYSVILAIPSTVYAVVFAKDVISLIYGAKYQGSVIAFQILMFAVCVIWLAGIFSYSLNAIGRQVDFLKATAVGAFVNIILNFTLIPGFGMLGAAVATVISEVAVLLIVLWSISSVVPFKIDPIRSLSFILLSFAFLSAVIFLAPKGIVFTLVLSGSIYIGLLYIFRIVGIEEVCRLQRMIYG